MNYYISWQACGSTEVEANSFSEAEDKFNKLSWDEILIGGYDLEIHETEDEQGNTEDEDDEGD